MTVAVCVSVLQYHCEFNKFCAFVGLNSDNWIQMHGMENVKFNVSITVQQSQYIWFIPLIYCDLRYHRIFSQSCFWWIHMQVYTATHITYVYCQYLLYKLTQNTSLSISPCINILQILVNCRCLLLSTAIHANTATTTIQHGCSYLLLFPARCTSCTWHLPNWCLFSIHWKTYFKMAFPCTLQYQLNLWGEGK